MESLAHNPQALHVRQVVVCETWDGNVMKSKWDLTFLVNRGGRAQRGGQS